MDPWQEPVRGGYPHEAFAALDGASRNQRMLEFSLPPPIAHLFGTRPTESGYGESSGVMPATGWLLSPQGRIPLGTVAIVADLAFGSAFGSTLPPGGGFTTAELTLYRLGTPTIGGLITAHGRLVHASGAVALTEAHVYDSEGHLVAAGMSRLAVFPPITDLPPVPDPPPRPVPPDYGSPDPWQRDPPDGVLDAEVWQGRSGLAVLLAQIDGELPHPPLSRLTGMRVAHAAPGTASVALPAHEWLATPMRTVQGGVTAMIADAALQCAIQTTVDAGNELTPLDIRVNYLRPVLPDGRDVTATGTVIHRGRSIAIAHADVHNADGQKVAVATGSAMISSPDRR